MYKSEDGFADEVREPNRATAADAGEKVVSLVGNLKAHVKDSSTEPLSALSAEETGKDDHE